MDKKSMSKLFVGENVTVNHHIDFRSDCGACRGHGFSLLVAALLWGLQLVQSPYLHFNQ